MIRRRMSRCWCETPGGPWRLAVNVRSDDETDLLFHIEPDFRGAILDAIDACPRA